MFSVRKIRVIIMVKYWLSVGDCELLLGFMVVVMFMFMVLLMILVFIIGGWYRDWETLYIEDIQIER